MDITLGNLNTAGVPNMFEEIRRSERYDEITVFNCSLRIL